MSWYGRGRTTPIASYKKGALVFLPYHSSSSCSKFPREPQLRSYISGLVAEVVRSRGVQDLAGTAERNKEDELKKGQHGSVLHLSVMAEQ